MILVEGGVSISISEEQNLSVQSTQVIYVMWCKCEVDSRMSVRVQSWVPRSNCEEWIHFRSI